VKLQTNTPSPFLVGSEMKDFLSLLSDKFTLYETAYSSLVKTNQSGKSSRQEAIKKALKVLESES